MYRSSPLYDKIYSRNTRAGPGLREFMITQLEETPDKVIEAALKNQQESLEILRLEELPERSPLLQVINLSDFEHTTDRVMETMAKLEHLAKTLKVLTVIDCGSLEPDIIQYAEDILGESHVRYKDPETDSE
ncbi:uncharacterized protein BYT42DRAFT_618091 [Radiomyces spectabilis]|uniref:uncharacterized protein n=1 Tax=Radiomyces spectabilis TaxID=64574 RepID=UPI002220A735|nr:uncharacterized protein BYT42DRAFT_618091 [Radiomyces spectabilis]KAI8367673.1 hypothetical protein BYT42DRAFT_618091 [Radiomyces spectabilis]